MPAPPTRLCRDCGLLDGGAIVAAGGNRGCAACGSPRLIDHAELTTLTIAHVDCDAYYASIEKRDRPELADQPLIVGGGQRGVVTTCCYVARRFGVRSAMPMARALQLCPQATVLRPDMEKYQRESQHIRALMRETADKLEPVSIDEAYLEFDQESRDEPPARALARLSLKIERRVGVTVSIGLAPNKLLAKLASDMDKPRGFRVIGRSDALSVIGPLKVSALPGIGPVMAGKLEAMNIRLVSDLWTIDEANLIGRFGLWARRMIAYGRGQDDRKVAGQRPRAVSIAAETTFDNDLRRFDQIEPILVRMCEKLAERLERSGLAAGGLTLKLRRADRTIITRACRLRQPTRRAAVMCEAARPTLADEIDGSRYRLVGVTATRLTPAALADAPDLFSAGH